MQTGKQDPVAFSKMAGGGNDFVVIDNRTARIENVPELTRRICTRALSVGADGLILVESSARATFRMRYYNSDGSLAAFCANGTRCAARFAFLNVIAPRKMTIETDAGLVGAEVGEGGLVTLSLPSPHAFRAQRPLQVGTTTVQGSSIVVGVPHYVVFLKDDPAALGTSPSTPLGTSPSTPLGTGPSTSLGTGPSTPLGTGPSTPLGTSLWAQDVVPLGRAIRTHPDLVPDGGANVNFVVARDAHSIEVRTYERGVEGETLSCGSGVVASAVVSALFRKVQSPVSVLTRSGITLEVSFELADGYAESVRLKGDARLIYRATITPETLEGFDAEFVRDPAARVTVGS